jgi:tetratricopeptide (TPR) repeat protein
VFLRKLFRFLPRSALGRALGAFNRGDLETAARLFEEILRSTPQPASDIVLCACETYLELAAELESRADWAGAVQALERAARGRARWADVQLRLGRRTNADQAAPVTPTSAPSKPTRATSRRSTGKGSCISRIQHAAAAPEAAHSGPEYAARELEELVHDLPDTNWASRDARARLEPLFTRLLAGPPSPVAAALETARAALRAGDNALAIGELKKLLQIHPRFPDLHNLLGVAYDNEEMTDDAIEEFEMALRSTRSTDARLPAWRSRARPDAEAQHHLRTVAAHESGNEVARSVLAQIESRSGAR